MHQRNSPPGGSTPSPSPLLALLNQPPPVPLWAPYAAYLPGVLVWYAGTVWRCDSPHTSGQERGGAPTSNLNLWTPVSSTHQSLPAPPQYAPPPYPPPYTSSPSNDTKYPPEKNPSPASSSTSSSTTVGPSHSPNSLTNSTASRYASPARSQALQEDTDRSQHDSEQIDELRGRRVWRVSGLGVCAYAQAWESRRRAVWEREVSNGRFTRDEWVRSAQIRTQAYRDAKGITPLVKWKLVQRGEPIPNDALPVGREAAGEVLYAARAWHEGGLHLGKAGRHLHDSASISYGGAELTLGVYEVLCAPLDDGVLMWVPFDHGYTARVNGWWQPVEGGRERDGTPLLVAKAEHERGLHPGKCIINDDHACVGYGGGELWVRPFSILVYATNDLR